MRQPIALHASLRALGLALVCFILQTTSVDAQERAPSKGQTLYLPIYSHMFYGNVGKSGKPSHLLLSSLVSIRNTDTKRPLRLQYARYYDTHGKLLGDRLGAPVLIPPLGTHEIFVELNDASGGSGANFLLKWDAEQNLSPPLVEALHVNMDGGKAVIFTTQATPISE